MRTWLTSAIALLSVMAFAQEKRQAPSYIEEVKVNNVTVDVQVRDALGAPVANLRLQDFRISEDGQEQKTTNFVVVTGGKVSSSADVAVIGQAAPRYVVVFFDLYQLIEADKKRVLNSLREQVAGGLPPGQLMAVVSFDGTLRVHTPPTASVEKLTTALKEVERVSATGLQRQIKLSAYNVSDGPLVESHATYEFRKAQNEEYWTEMRRIVGRVEAAFAATLDRFANVSGRKVVILVSPGFPRADNVPMYRVYDFFLDTSTIDYRNIGLYGRVASLASELEFTLYTLDPSGISTLENDASSGYVPQFNDVAAVRFWREADRKDSLIRAARLTGGEAMFTGDGGAALSDVERITSSYYSLAFQPNHFGDGKEHKIKVEVVGQPGYTLTYRTSYLDRPADQRSAERTRAALLTGDSTNTLGIQLVLDKPKGKFHFGAQGMKRYRIGAELRIPYAHLVMIPRGPVAWGMVQIVIVANDPGGDQSDLAHQKVPIELPVEKLEEAKVRGYFAYTFSFEMEGGQHSLHVGVDDTLGNTTSAVSADLKL
jgi:VWFA-related protein